MATGVPDAPTARLAERAGFPALYMTGFGATAARLGMPDIGLMCRSMPGHSPTSWRTCLAAATNTRTREVGACPKMACYGWWNGLDQSSCRCGGSSYDVSASGLSGNLRTRIAKELEVMISVVIPTLDAENGLAATLTSLVPAAVTGLVREVIVVDGGSRDRTLEIADSAGARIVRASGGRGTQLKAGAEAARFPWLLFLHADTVLETDWEREVEAFMERVEQGARPPTAAAFRFALDDIGFKPRVLETLVSLRCVTFRLPYGDQGLLIPRRLYDRLGGYKPIPLMEDVDIVRALGRQRLVLLRARAVTSAFKYRRDGYARRSLRNLTCLTLYFLRVSPSSLLRIYR